MSDDRFHLGWFMNFTPDEWNEPFAADGGNPWTGDFYIDMARALERACFDYIMIEDTLMVSDAYGGTMEAYLKYALMAPKHDPSPLAAIMAAATTRLGVVATMSTTFYPPFMLARLCSTLDHIARGRFGWNIVTSGEDGSAKSFGMDELTEHDLRYDIADEYVDLVCQLFESWEPGAVVLDRESNTYAEHDKVHTIDFEGKYFKCRGPLNTVPSPQGRPAFIQAGGSPKGRQFAAKSADSIIATANGIEGMLEDFIEQALAGISSVTDVDFSQFELDEPLPEITTDGEQGSLNKFAQWGSGKTLRQLVLDSGGVADSVELVGTPDTVAAKMGEIMEEVGGDGFLISSPGMRNSRRYINEITDGLVPALQRRGLVRTEYAFEHLRDTLLEF